MHPAVTIHGKKPPVSASKSAREAKMSDILNLLQSENAALFSPSNFNCWKNFYKSSYLNVAWNEKVGINAFIFNKLGKIRVW